MSVATFTKDAFNELSDAIDEMMSLTGPDMKFDRRAEARHAALLQKISVLKLGVTPHEMRMWQLERLSTEIGLQRSAAAIKRKLPAATEREWRDFGRGLPVQLTSIPKDSEVRANEAGTSSITYTMGPQGGRFVPQDFYTRFAQVLKQHDQIFDDQFSTIIETSTGANMPVPVLDDVSASAVQISETTAPTEVDLGFGVSQLGAFTFRSGLIAISLELIQDSGVPWPQLLEEALALRHARGIGAALVTGSGVNAPEGLITGILSSGGPIVVASGSAAQDGGSETGSNSIGVADLNAAYGKLDRAYRSRAAWAMNDNTVVELQALTDKVGRPLVEYRGLAGVGDVPVLLGRPIATCPSFPVVESKNNSVAFYSVAHYLQRRVPSSAYVQRFAEAANLIEYGLCAFQSYFRVSSAFVAPDANYVGGVLIQNHS
ncbi:MAG: phage major capsid protein [Candidatus Acidiferrales bacterium]